MTKAAKILMINDLLKTKMATYVPSMLINDPIIVQWYQVNNVYSDHAASWNNEILAKAICGFDDILKYINGKVAVSHESLPGAIETFITYMSTVAKVAEIAKYAREPGPRKIGTQKGGETSTRYDVYGRFKSPVIRSKQLPQLPTQVCSPNWKILNGYS